MKLLMIQILQYQHSFWNHFWGSIKTGLDEEKLPAKLNLWKKKTNQLI